jgi:hypothetical protein
MRLLAVCAQLPFVFFFALVDGALAQDTTSGSQTESTNRPAPPSLFQDTASAWQTVSTNPPAPPSLFIMGTPQFQPAAAGGSAETAPAPRLAGTSQLAASPPVSETALVSDGEGLLQWGILQFHPNFLYQISYGNGLQAQPGEQANTLVNRFSPGLLIRLGSHWTLNYTPTLIFYSNPLFQNVTDQAVSLNGSTTYRDWTFGLSAGYSSTSQPLVETAGQTSQEVYSMALSAGYQVSSKVSLDLGLNQNLRFVGRLGGG